MSVSRLPLGLYALSLTFLGTATASAQPTDNPITAHYVGDPHLADYAWTDLIVWDRVFNVLDYGGVADGNTVGDGVGVTDNRDAFHAAVAAAHAAGGGVVYLPAGTYYFSDTLYLKSGVVVRGATPTLFDAHDAAFAPPTRLEFPKYFFDPTANDGTGVANSTAFKLIQVEDNGFASDLGLVWLDINRAGISLAASGEGTENRLVFGIRSNNVASADANVPALTRVVAGEERPFQHAWQRYSNRFARNINVMAERNVLVANNRCNDLHFAVDHALDGADPAAVDDFMMPGYIIQDTKRAFQSDSTAFYALQAQHLPKFSYTNHYGINVRGSSGSVWGAAPYENPSLFLAGMTVRDNWVYTTMRVGYHTSGYGLKVLNNIKEDQAGKVWWIHPTGLASLAGATTLENRGLDVGGSSILVEGNNLRVFRHRVNNGPYLSTDGEGILVQECCGGTTLDDVVITNNTVNAYIGLYKMPYTRNVTISDNLLTDAGFIMVNANKNGTQAPLFDIVVERNQFTSSGGINVTGLSGGAGVVIRDNTLAGGGISYPADISTVTGNTGQSGLTAIAIGEVRDYPLIEVEDPSDEGHLEPGAVTVRARVTGSRSQPAPAQVGDLPDVTRVDLYVDRDLLASFTTNPLDPEAVAYLYEASWFPAPGSYQLAARATPVGYAGPTGSTEWFTVSHPVHVQVGVGAGASALAAWEEVHFPGATDPAVSGDEADPDGDGIPNLLEFALGTDPWQSDAARAPSVMQTGENVLLRFTLRDELDRKLRYVVTQSNDFVNWTEVPLSALSGAEVDTALPGSTTYEYTVPSSPTAPMFLRLEVRRKP